MEIEKYYGFYFCGENYQGELSQTYLPVDQLELEHLLSETIDYSRGLKFKVLFGFIKELTMMDGKVYMNSPSRVGNEKYQAFILKRKGDEISQIKNDFYINGEKLELSFKQYNVTILDVET